jgi:TRAP-type C4-dicarboxylate transport system permease small subunit
MFLLRKLDAALARLEDLLLIIAMAVITGLVGLGVVLRYVFSSPLTWSEEFIVTLFVWTVMLGIPSAFRVHMHLRIDVLVLRLGKTGRAVAGALACLCAAAIVLATIYAGVLQVKASWTTQTPMLGISSGWTFLALPVSLSLLLLHGIVMWWQSSAEALLQNATEAVVDAAQG